MTHIEVNTTHQTLQLLANHHVLFEAAISTAFNGLGEICGSGCTPRGWLVIKAKIGENCPLNSVFVGRRATGEIYTPELGQRFPERDWILTRILWLGGLEPYKNRYQQVDTLRRHIYLHGCPDALPMGVPLSHGCIRMRNLDIIELFDKISVGTKVLIV
jgi:L,D-transpeptidase YbiS